MLTSTLLAILALAYPCLAQYELKWKCDATNMFDEFDFIQSKDKFTKGFAQYVSKAEALSSGLAKYVNDKVYIGVDTKDKYALDSDGRKSIRIHSIEKFDNGLLIGDFAHLPVAGCGMWPAYWVYTGEEVEDESIYSEIDLIENVNNATAGVQSFYTGSKCTVNVHRGKIEEGNDNECQHLDDGSDIDGCQFEAESNTFGQAFNEHGYRYNVLLVEDDEIKVWYFKDSEAPGDINSTHPDPSKWVNPMVHLTPKSCDFAKQFSHYHVVINLTFCGSWAGQDWTPESECAVTTNESTCEKWVAEYPEDFEETYFEINSVKHFQKKK